MSGEATAFQIAMEAKAHVEVLEERFDRHLNEVKDASRTLGDKVDALNATTDFII